MSRKWHIHGSRSWQSLGKHSSQEGHTRAGTGASLAWATPLELHWIHGQEPGDPSLLLQVPWKQPWPTALQREGGKEGGQKIILFLSQGQEENHRMSWVGRDPTRIEFNSCACTRHPKNPTLCQTILELWQPWCSSSVLTKTLGHCRGSPFHFSAQGVTVNA